MLKTILFLMSLVLSTGLVATFGFAALAVFFGLCLLTLVVSCTGVEDVEDAAQTETRPAALAG